MDKKLITAVVRQLGGRDHLEDVARYGAGVGIPGFVYYNETVPFYTRNQPAIQRLVEETADAMGESPTRFVARFHCLSGDYSEAEVGRTLYGSSTKKRPHDTQIANALAWFALEEVARHLTEEAT